MNYRDLRGRPLTKGKNDKGEYDRELKFGPGYGELLKIVAELQKEVKRINQAVTLQGAQEYASKRKNWEAFEEDITGPEGKPDGIPEVIVTDAKGNVRIVNGMTLAKSKYPVRRAYRTKNEKLKAEGKEPMTYGQFKEFYGTTEYNPKSGQLEYVNEMEVGIGPEFANVQKEIKARDAFKDIIFKPQYSTTKTALEPQIAERGLKVEPMQWAQTFNKVLATAYNETVVFPILQKMGVPRTADKKTINKYKRGEAFKRMCADEVIDIINNGNRFSEVQANIDSEIVQQMLRDGILPP